MALTKVTQHSLGNSAVTTAKLGTAPFGFANSSANIVYMAANGNVGIGTSTPGYKLQTKGDAVGVTSADGTVTNIINYNTIGTVNAADLAIVANNATRMTVASNGNIGIGTTSPGFKLDVAGEVKSSSYYQLSSGSDAKYFGVGNALTGIYAATDLAIWNVSSGNILFYQNAGERMRIDSSGYGIIGSTNSTGDYGTSPGMFAAAGNTAWNSGHVLKAYSLNTGFSEGGGGISFIGCRRSNSSAYVMLGIYSGNDGNSIAADREFLVRGDGYVYADNSFNGGGADYAEYFEWADGNSNNEDRRGFSVVLVGDEIRKATSQDSPDSIIGVVSANPSVVGDAQYDKWKDKYVRDEFGEYVRDPHNVVEWTDNDGKHHTYREGGVPEDVVVPSNATTSSIDSNGNPYEHRRLNTDYDPTIPYVPREDRPEWDAIGLMGKLRIRKGQPTGTRWIKMRNISETVEEWLVR